MTDPAAPAAAPAAATPSTTAPASALDAVEAGLSLATQAKAGYKTTEFWMKVAALALTVAFSTGLIHTTGTVATVAGIAATMLGALGYTVCRSWVKAA